MGSFDPRMSVHGEEAEAHHDKEPSHPMGILSGTLWQLTTILIVFMIVIGFVAVVPGGPALRTVGDPLGSSAAVGFTDVNLFGIQIPQVSELVIFIALIIIMMLSLFVAAGALGWAFTALSRGVAEAQAAPHTPLTRQLLELPSGAAGESEAATPTRPTFPSMVYNALFAVAAVLAFIILYQFVMPVIANNILGNGTILRLADDAKLLLSLAGAFAIASFAVRPPGFLMFLGVFLAMALALYPIFYHVAVGLVYLAFPSIGPITPEVQRVAASLLNAIIIPLLILRPKFLTRLIGRLARWLAGVLRWVGTVK
jgi:hypothetical protein